MRILGIDPKFDSADEKFSGARRSRRAPLRQETDPERLARLAWHRDRADIIFPYHNMAYDTDSLHIAESWSPNNVMDRRVHCCG